VERGVPASKVRPLGGRAEQRGELELLSDHCPVYMFGTLPCTATAGTIGLVRPQRRAAFPGGGASVSW
jgi:hypothetical protein